MGQKQNRIRQKEQQDQTEKQKRRYIEKWYQIDSPEIPEGGSDIRHPRPPFGGGGEGQWLTSSTCMLSLSCDRLVPKSGLFDVEYNNCARCYVINLQVFLCTELCLQCDFINATFICSFIVIVIIPLFHLYFYCEAPCDMALQKFQFIIFYYYYYSVGLLSVFILQTTAVF